MRTIIASLLYFACGAGASYVHLYTIYLAYIHSGIFAAGFSACFPPISNLYWMYERWLVTGDALNYYTIINLVLVLFLIFYGLISRNTELNDYDN